MTWLVQPSLVNEPFSIQDYSSISASAAARFCSTSAI
jgi:hypothetical protein